MKKVMSRVIFVLIVAIVLAGCSRTPIRRLTDLSTPPPQPTATDSAATATTVPPTDVPATNVPATSTAAPPTASPVSPSPTTGATASSAIEQAIRDVVQAANSQQVEAFTKKDPSPMRPTATSAYFAKLQQINLDLQNGGVSAIKLVDLQWGPITVKGATTAEVTTTETWRTSYDDGTTDESSDRNVYSLVNQGGVWLIAEDLHPDVGTSNPSTGTSPGVGGNSPAPPVSTTPLGPGQSRNWSGYAATGGKYTSVTGTWIIPKPTAGTVTTTAATWVGIGGAQSHDLIQAGTEESTSTQGQVRYNAWIEMLPDVSHRVTLAVKAGDSVTVTITQQSAGTWLITMLNNTTNQKYESTQQYNSSMSSADWVEEAPSGGRRVLPLENFGTIQFSASTAVKDGKSQTAAQLGAKSIAMVDGAGRVLANPSAIAKDGTSFTITRAGSPTTSLPQFSTDIVAAAV